MDLREFEIFRTVAREQSIPRAARLLERVQATVESRVRQLEERLGVTLFHRQSRRMILTPEGHKLLRYADQMLALANEARVAMLQQDTSWRLRIGSMECGAATYLPKALARLNSAWPNVEFELSSGTTAELVNAVHDGRLDCAVVAHPLIDEPREFDVGQISMGLEGTFLRSEELVLISSARQPPFREARDVRAWHLAAFGAGCTYRQCAQDWLTRAGMQHAVSVVEMRSYHAIFAYVSTGSAVAAAPRALLELQPEAVAFNTVPICQVQCYLIRKQGPSTFAVEALSRELRIV
ncbi:HTH-type transcriptional regulator GltR [compost metagenome]